MLRSKLALQFLVDQFSTVLDRHFLFLLNASSVSLSVLGRKSQSLVRASKMGLLSIIRKIKRKEKEMRILMV